jgi:membrane protease YdiL (CAAX protease family)
LKSPFFFESAVVLKRISILLFIFIFEKIIQICYVEFYINYAQEFIINVDNKNYIKLSNEYLSPSIYNFFYVSIIAPVIEEIIFRSWLINFKRYFLAIIVVLIGYITPSFTYKPIIIFSLLIYFIHFQNNFFKIDLKSIQSHISSNKFKYSFLSSLLFGFLHQLNYVDSNGALLWTGAYDVVHFITGFTLCMIRINFGLKYAIFYHVTNNSLAFLLKIKLGSGA